MLENQEWLWKKNKQSWEQKHRRILESIKVTLLMEYKEELERKIQIWFIWKIGRKGKSACFKKEKQI